MWKDRKVEQMAGIPLFAGADHTQLDRIAGCCTQVRLPAGKVLCRQGQVARELLVVEEGHAWVQVDDRKMYELAPGDYFGGLALLAGQESSATLTASTAMAVLTLTRAELCSVLDAAPFLAPRLLRTSVVPGRQAQAIPDQRGQRVDVPHQPSAAGG